MTLDSSQRASLEERVRFLEDKLAAKERTIDALMRRVEDKLAERTSSFLMLEQSLALEHVVTNKTADLIDQKARLAAALAELRQTQVKLLQAQKLEAIGQLAAGIAHEVNTPSQYVTDNVTFLQRAFVKLNDVVAAHERVSNKARAGEDCADELDELDAVLATSKLDYLRKQIPRAIQQSLEGMGQVSSIVKAMKEFSHPSGGESQPMDIHDVIESTTLVAKNEWKYVADLELAFDWSLPPVPILRNELSQVFLNLIVNAAHAIAAALPEGSTEKGKITIGTRVVGSAVEIRVSDSGAGIPKAVQDRIFEPFFTTKEVGKGTGQGLAIAYSVIVDKHRGSIGFESEEGRGTTFIINLPLAVDAPGSEASS